MQTTLDTTAVLQTIKVIKENLTKLEMLLTESTVTDPYKRRRDILRAIFWAGNDIRKEELLPVLAQKGTNSRWIGQQVKIGYLSVIRDPRGQVRYAVMPKAIKELHLTKADEENMELAKLAERSFAEDWDSPEDSIYDDL